MISSAILRRFAFPLCTWIVVVAVSLALQYWASSIDRALTEILFAATLVLVVIVTSFLGAPFRRQWVWLAALVGGIVGYLYFFPQWQLIEYLFKSVFHDSVQQQHSIGALVGGFRWLVTAFCLLGSGAAAFMNDRRDN